MNEREGDIFEEILRYGSWRSKTTCERCGDRWEEEECNCGNTRTLREQPTAAEAGSILHEMLGNALRNNARTSGTIPKGPGACLACGAKKTPGEPACVECGTPAGR